MAIKPILFNTEMVRAILDGRKSCTRRIIKPQWEECPHCKYVHKEYIYGKLAENVYCAKCGYPLLPERRAPYQPGDILYVRETWKKAPNGYYYYEDWQRNDIADVTKWKPSIHMPKEAARIWLKVTDVRVERLQDITSEQIGREGVEVEYPHVLNGEEKRYAFSRLWDSTIKKSDLDRYGWNASPWVWVIEFERCEKPEGV
jgi:hypothetical protein